MKHHRKFLAFYFFIYDTGASNYKSLLAKGILELSEPSTTGETVVVKQGFLFNFY